MLPILLPSFQVIYTFRVNIKTLLSYSLESFIFSIYSLMEEIEEDTLYFFTKSNLDSRIDFRSDEVSKRNSHETKKKYDEEDTPER